MHLGAAARLDCPKRQEQGFDHYIQIRKVVASTRIAIIAIITITTTTTTTTTTLQTSTAASKATAHTTRQIPTLPGSRQTLV